jgi:26S proteasome regulatory subunit N5
VDTKTIYAKIDRPGGIVLFRKPEAHDEVLNTWSHKIT